MNKFFSRIGILIPALYLLGFVSGCDDSEPPLPANLVNFEATSVGMGDDVTETDIALNFSRAVSEPVSLTITFTTDGVTYGEHFTTVPAATGNSLTLTVPAASSSASFKVIRKADVFLEGDESISFSISDAGDPAGIGTTTQVTLTFASIVSEGAELTLNGLIADEPGAEAGNTVFVDLSENKQTPVARTNWDLGFYNGDVFRVVINNWSGASAISVDETDLAAVSSEDIDLDDLRIGGAVGSFETIDDIDGDISNTAIAEISATDAENKVYVINRIGGGGSVGEVEDLIKIRVVRKGDGYTVHYAGINETTVTSIDIAKSSTHNFEYFHFDNGKVAVEPAKDKWDIQWGWSIYRTGAPGNYIPYAFSDLIFLNHLNGTEAAEVMVTPQLTYDNFQESDVSGVSFSGSRTFIGSTWRVTSPAAQAGVRGDRFYLIRDADGNVYKLKFINFHPNDSGTRGKPVVRYALVKKAE